MYRALQVGVNRFGIQFMYAGCIPREARSGGAFRGALHNAWGVNLLLLVYSAVVNLLLFDLFLYKPFDFSFIYTNTGDTAMTVNAVFESYEYKIKKYMFKCSPVHHREFLN